MTVVQDLFFAGALIYKQDENGDWVPTWKYRVGPFQQACRESGMTWEDIARKGGWADASYLTRMLGLRPSTTRKKNGRNYGPYFTETITYRNAARLARALDLDFVFWEV